MENDRQRYNTKQQALIYEYFKNNKGSHFTADAVSDALKSCGVSRATVYRSVEKLTEEGVLIKYNFGKGQSACYQFCSDDAENGTFHFVCTKCKTLQHLDCDMLSDLQDHLNRDHAVKIDRSLTVLYGTCGRCLNK